MPIDLSISLSFWVQGFTVEGLGFRISGFGVKALGF